MAAVRLDRVSKVFAGHAAVDNVSLSIRDGEFMVLVGPSGCGKSTTLRMIAGLEAATSGEIYFGDRLVTELEPRERNVAMVFQNYALYPHKTVYENIAFGLKMRSVDKEEVDKRVRRAAAMLGLEELLMRKPRQLSGGQMQRVALGRALVRQPDVFLLDEPLSNLDAKLRVRMREEIAKLHREIGVSTIYVTHDQVEAMTLGSRICVMKDGRIQQVGTPLEVYDRPANQFVAGFIGSPEMNFVAGHLEGGVFRAGGLALPLSRRGADGEATLGIRPEHLALTEGREAGGVRIAARVTLVEQMGAQTLLVTDCQGVALRALIDRHDHIAAGMEVGLEVDPAKLHLFGKTGEAITK